MAKYKAVMELRKAGAIGRFYDATIFFEAPYPYDVPKSNLYDVAIRAALDQGYETSFIHRVELAE